MFHELINNYPIYSFPLFLLIISLLFICFILILTVLTYIYQIQILISYLCYLRCALKSRKVICTDCMTSYTLCLLFFLRSHAHTSYDVFYTDHTFMLYYLLISIQGTHTIDAVWWNSPDHKLQVLLEKFLRHWGNSPNPTQKHLLTRSTNQSN